ncbi:hypothetical protein HWV62_31815 [Athelia sp. TMB]|nr:hypothetical protein HWV62_31815 [Athelia sp. TMB]
MAAWALSDAVLMDFDNYTVIDNLYMRVDICDVMAMGATCKRGRVLWIEYRGRQYNMNKMLATHVGDTTTFRSLMDATHSVIVGPCLTNFLRRNPTAPHSLAVVVNINSLARFKSYLENFEGYAAWVGEEQTQAKGEGIESTRRRSARTGLRSGALSVAAAGRLEDPIQNVITMERKTDGNPTTYIILTTARTCVAKTLMTPVTTMAANFMTANTIVSLYPRATFITQVGYRVYRKLGIRLWSVPSMTHAPYGYTRPRAVATEAACKYLNVDGGWAQERYLGDGQSWVLHYDVEGNNTGNANTSVREREAWVYGSQWRTRVENGNVYMDVRKAILAATEGVPDIGFV